MNLCKAFIAAATFLCTPTLPLSAQSQRFNGFLGFETRSFSDVSFNVKKTHSLVGEIRSRGDITDSFSYDLRLYRGENLGGAGGSYFDPTVAKFTFTSGNWQFDAGYDLLFWGVAEGRNVVNIINQRDQIRDPFSNQGLGQGMISARYFGSAVTVEAFVLPHFKKLNFGADGRPWGLGMRVDGSNSTFESAAGSKHVDLALRVSRMAGNLEYAAFGFDGTLRQPEYRFDPVSTSLVPHYILGRQFGIEAQYTAGATILKLESVKTWPKSSDSYISSIFGVEYTVGNIFDLPAEASLFAEYYHDTRQNDPTVTFQNDIFLGAQLRFSNSLDTRLEMGAIFDLDYGGVMGSISISSRITDSIRVSADLISIHATNPKDGLFNARNYDQASLKLEWHF